MKVVLRNSKRASNARHKNREEFVPRTLEQVLDEHPELTYAGFVPPTVRTVLGAEVANEEHLEMRAELYLRRDEIEWVRSWLEENLVPNRDARRSRVRSSYSLKHLAEKEAPNGYVSSGAIIIGALMLGWPVRRNRRHAWIGASLRSIHRTIDRIEREMEQKRHWRSAA